MKNSLDKKLLVTNASSKIKKVIAVVGGKGGTGKSMVTSMTAIAMAKRGISVGIIDADITGSSILNGFGVKEKAKANAEGIPAAKSSKGIKLMSTSMMLDRDTEPVVWRGVIIGNMFKQFWTDVTWGDIDCLLIDMPTGTGDVALTVYKSLPVDGVLIVTSPQEHSGGERAIVLAERMGLPIVGIVENMSYYTIDGKDHKIFGDSHTDEAAKKYKVKVLSKLPINPEVAKYIDAGKIEKADTTLFEPVADAVELVKPRAR
ncbi:MAG: Mrp/NBP35 family ATP-binding protein [Deferribacteraceae bacterium]|nr:Mrp/NBP35 family ATP-binding protein [Deferribacteraceae bacterium]